MSKIYDFMVGRASNETAHQLVTPKSTQVFSVPIGSDYSTWLALVGGNAVTAVTREVAMQVPAVKRARDLICSTTATLPIHAYRGNERIDNTLLDQPEKSHGHTRIVTISDTLDDLLFHKYSLWVVLEKNAEGFPVDVHRVPHGRWTQDFDGTVRVDGEEVKQENVRLFISPNDSLLSAGAGPIRVLRLLEATAGLYADQPEPAEYFTPTEGEDPTADEVITFLNDYRNARKSRSAAFIPAGFDRHEVNRMTADELALVGSREFGIKDIARLTGVPSDWLSVEVTTRTYNNSQDERRAYVDFVIAPYVSAIEQTLSMGNMTPRGTYCKFNYDAFLRANTKERYETYAIANTIKDNAARPLLTHEEMRTLENKLPLEYKPLDEVIEENR